VKGKLRKLSCSGATRFKLDQLLDSLEFNEKQIFKTTREIRRFLNNDAELSQCMKYLMTIPGVGWIVASQLLARIGDGLRGIGGFKFAFSCIVRTFLTNVSDTGLGKQNKFPIYSAAILHQMLATTLR